MIVPWLTWADLDLRAFRSETFMLEWPPRSGLRVQTPEIDKVAYFDLTTALGKALGAQRPMLLEAAEVIRAG